MKRFFYALTFVFLLTTLAWAATKNIVPRANGEGSVWTAAKHWGGGYIDNLAAAGINWDSNKLATSNINWGGLEEIQSKDVNWTDIEALNGEGQGGRAYDQFIPFTINNPTAGTPKTIWTNLTGFVFHIKKIIMSATSSCSATLYRTGSNANLGINWLDIENIEPVDMDTLSDPQGMIAGINYYDARQEQIGSINWDTIQPFDRIGINWDDTSPTEVTGIIAGYLDGNGINWDQF